LVDGLVADLDEPIGVEDEHAARRSGRSVVRKGTPPTPSRAPGARPSRRGWAVPADQDRLGRRTRGPVQPQCVPPGELSATHLRARLPGRTAGARRYCRNDPRPQPTTAGVAGAGAGFRPPPAVSRDQWDPSRCAERTAPGSGGAGR
jgi:hypothetical protein